MNWHYEDKGQQVGPVTDEELLQRLQTGQINEDTLVWNPDLPDWLPYRQAKAQSNPPRLPAPPRLGSQRANPAHNESVCAECGQYFPTDELITLNQTLICARCKPVFLQRMVEGVSTPGASGLWREGRKLFTLSETPFPDRCIKCNGPAHGFRLKRVLYWQHPAYYLLLLCNLIVLLIVVMIVRKKAVVHIGLCDDHRRARQTALIACSVGMLGGVAMMIAGGVLQSGWMAILGVAGFLTGIIWGLVKGRTIYASKIEGNKVWISGVSRAFLDELPER